MANKHYINIIYCVIILALSLPCLSCGREVFRYSRPVLGTVATITVMAHDQDEAIKAIEAAFSEIERIEKLMSPFLEGSDLWRLNRKAHMGPVTVRAETFQVLKESMTIAADSGGAFDVTFAPLGEIWNYKKTDFTPPPDWLIARTKKLVNYRNVMLDPQNRSVRFLVPGMRVGLGAIAKGFAVGRAMAVLASLGIEDCIVEIGGDLMVRGSKGGSPWVVGLRHPRKEGILAAITLEGSQAVVTSGDYERRALYKGKRYHHIIDPRTGGPTETFESVTVICSDPMKADAYATALFVLGPSGYREFCAKHKHIAVILIDLEGKVVMSKELEGKVEFMEKVEITVI